MGVRVEGSGNRIGGTASADRNVISGNQGAASSSSQGWGVYLATASESAPPPANNTIAGNFIGVNVTGAKALPNGTGVSIENGVDNNVGGSTPGSRNILSGNAVIGVTISGGLRNVISANYIGTDVSGTLAIPNESGVAIGGIPGTGNTIGGVTTAERNLISGNTNDGVKMGRSGVVLGNYIGTDVTGRNPLPNNMNGVEVRFGAIDVTVGGTTPGAGNLIAYNGLNGVSVLDFNTKQIAILGNSIYSSGRLGINLGGLSTVVPNDPLDADTGPNNLQNFPVLDTVERVGASVTISGALNSLPNTSFRIELFSSKEGNPSGFGEGQTFLGFTNVTTDASGNASFSSTVTTPAAEGFFTATATRLSSSGTPVETSGFSAGLLVEVELLECEVTTLNVPGISATATLTDDADNPGLPVLLVTGTARNDVIIVEPRPANSSQIRVKINGKVAGFFATADVSRIVAFGLAGNDTIIVNATLSQSSLLLGDAGSDLLYGGRGDDQIDGGAGHDKVFGGGGNDTLCGGTGQDYVYGGLGDDIVGGDAGNDRLYGEAGNDLVLGGDGNDLLYGGAGHDRLYGQEGNDQLLGEAGNDLLIGGAGNDTLRGGAGRDIAIGGFGKDTLFGDAGDDILIANSMSIDEDDATLQELLAAWITSGSFASRLDAIRSVATPEDITDDLLTDTLYGGLGQDWFIIGTNGKPKDRAKNEPVN